MTKITNELLEDYALCYPRIECVRITSHASLFKPVQAISLIQAVSRFSIKYIQLRSIESITDEEVKGLNLMWAKKPTKRKEFIKSIKSVGFHLYSYNTIDKLRSIGIATPFREITVDKLVESGKLKLI